MIRRCLNVNISLFRIAKFPATHALKVARFSNEKDSEMPPTRTEVEKWQGITETDMLDFMSTCLKKAGASASHADIVSQVLVSADKRGIYSHGINKLGKTYFNYA